MMNHLLQCTAAALLAIGIVFSARRTPPRVRFLILLVALLRFVVPTTWLVNAGTSIADCLPHSVAAPIVTRLDGLLRPGSIAEPSAQVQSSSTGFPMETALGLIWLAGTLCSAGLWIVRATRKTAAVREAHAYEGESLRNAAARMKVRTPKLLVAAANVVPGVVGVLRPRLVLPEGLSSILSAQEIEAVFAHELGHLRRHDNFFAMASRLIASVFWFHPLVWWMEHRMLVERELACDEMVLASGARKEDYSAALSKVCRSTWIVNATFAGATGPDFKERLERIMTQEIFTKPSWAVKSAPGFVAAMALLVPLFTGFASAQSSGSAADALFQAAQACVLQKDYAKAEELYRKMYEQYASDYRGVTGLANVYDAQGRIGDAIALLREGAARNPRRMELSLGLGNLLTRAERYSEAIKEFERALNLAASPEATAGIYSRIGEAYRRAGALDKSMAALQRAKEFSGKTSLNLALILDGTGKKDRAMVEYKALLSENPSQPVVLNNLAYILAERGGNLDDALGYALRARQALPEVDDVADTLGWIYLKKRMPEPAIAAFSDALALHKDGDFREVRLHLAAALDLKGDLNDNMRELRGLLPLAYTAERDHRIKELLRSIRN